MLFTMKTSTWRPYQNKNDPAFLWQYLEPLSKNGTNRHTSRGGNTTPRTKSDVPYKIRRLKRDNPELANKVISGELSANGEKMQLQDFAKDPTV
jgi:hypothetical protein